MLKIIHIASVSLLLILTALFTTAYAHKINTFAYEEAGVIYCEATFSGGRPAKGSEVKVMLSTTPDQAHIIAKTDDTGKFNFEITDLLRDTRPDITIIITSDDGHKNSWLLRAGEYLTDSINNQNSTNKEAIHEPGFKEVAIGFGCIFGLAGLTLLIRSKKNR